MRKIFPENGQSAPDEETKTKHIVTATDILKPIILLLKTCGTYSTPYGSRMSFRKKLHWFYCIKVQLVVLLTSARYFSVFKHGSSRLFRFVGLLSYMWFYLTLSFYSVGCYILNKGHMQGYIEALNSYHEQYGIHPKLQNARLVTRILSVGAVVYAIVHYLCLYISYFATFYGENLLITSNLTPFENEEGATFDFMIVLFCLLGILSHLIIFSNIIFVLASAYIFTLEFKRITLEINKIVKEDKTITLGDIRLQYEHLVGVLDKGNVVFRYVSLIVYCYGLPVVCLMLYGATGDHFAAADIIAMVTSLIGAVIGMFIITFMGAVLNNAAHEPLLELFKIDIGEISTRTMAQMGCRGFLKKNPQLTQKNDVTTMV